MASALTHAHVAYMTRDPAMCRDSRLLNRALTPSKENIEVEEVRSPAHRLAHDRMDVGD